MYIGGNYITDMNAAILVIARLVRSKRIGKMRAKRLLKEAKRTLNDKRYIVA